MYIAELRTSDVEVAMYTRDISPYLQCIVQRFSAVCNFFIAKYLPFLLLLKNA